ncbi:hypothetical protein [Mucilaginibacter humi]|nr:hypothetical protein [Mucilaginibacter humi]
MAMFNGHVYGLYQYLIAGDFEPEEKDRIINEAYDMLWDMMKYM